MPGRRLLATDLDRTLIPNGTHEESPGARSLLAALVRAKRLLLAYVTGRSLPLVEEAIAAYDLPVPDWVLADVGSTLYRRDGARWEESAAWADRLAEDWPGRNGPELAELFTDLPELRLQAADAQRPFKLSFLAPPDADPEDLRARIAARLAPPGLPSAIVCSLDEARSSLLVDVLPAASSKRGALEFLMTTSGLAPGDVLFAGDSGNDRDVLTSPLPAVLVANADDELRAAIAREAARLGTAETLHLARGGVLGLNGNYAAGILEGWLHFHPDDLDFLARLP